MTVVFAVENNEATSVVNAESRTSKKWQLEVMSVGFLKETLINLEAFNLINWNSFIKQ